MARTLVLVPVTLAALVAFDASPARAQYVAERQMSARPAALGTPERFAVELRGGPYTPDVGPPLDDSFGDDDGPLLAGEIDVFLLRIPYVGHVGIGGGFGWTRYTGRAVTPDGEETEEETSLTLLPIPILAVLRIDVLARELDIPLLVTGKIGVDVVPWSVTKGNEDSGSGVGVGLHWGVQLGLELDFFDRAAARSLDEEWGINHTFVFGELFGSHAEDQFSLADVTWAIGLGFIL